VLPFHLEATSAWTARSWDRTLIPKPFSTVVLVVGEPVAVAAHLDATAIEAATRDLESRLGRLETRAHQLAGS
jgi:lysophospholipid acyltransferase (LPLAT)-like uncharacterized protein